MPEPEPEPEPEVRRRQLRVGAVDEGGGDEVKGEWLSDDDIEEW